METASLQPQWVQVSLSREADGAPLPLPSHEIHVWRVAFAAEPAGAAQTAAHAFRDNARRMLCTIAASYLAPSAAYVLSHDPRGRPHMGDDSLRLSASHTAGLALFAIARRPVGVDVEIERLIGAREVIARSYFSTGERASLGASGADAAVRFLETWTRKEAYLKALGCGFQQPPRAIDTSAEERSGVFNASDPFDSLRWTVRSFRASSQHIAAIAHARDRGAAFRWLTLAPSEDQAASDTA